MKTIDSVSTESSRAMGARDAVEWHSAIAEQFDAAYARSKAFRERERIWSRMIERFARPDGATLDAGCGSGVMGILAAQRSREVLCFDASPEMIAIAQKRREAAGAANVSFHVGKVGTADIAQSRAFDLVLCSSVLEYVEDYWLAIDWLVQATTATGVLVFSMPDGGSLYRRAERGVFALTGKPAYLAHVRNMPRLSDVERGLEERKLEVLALERFGVPAGLAAAARATGLNARLAPLFLIACRRAA